MWERGVWEVGVREEGCVGEGMCEWVCVRGCVGVRKRCVCVCEGERVCV